MTGIYVHVPFCVSKCPYCDFYSLPLSSVDADMRARYAAAVVREMERYDGVCADTLYFGGGTPSLLGGENLAAVIAAARKRFSLSDDAEVTLEANPADDLYETLAAFAAAGGNRLSLGMQASSADRLKTLGRRHTPRAKNSSAGFPPWRPRPQTTVRRLNSARLRRCSRSGSRQSRPSVRNRKAGNLHGSERPVRDSIKWHMPTQT